MNINDWARAWGINPAHPCIADLHMRLGVDGAFALAHPKRPEEGASESRAQSEVRLEAARKDVILWRNNVGALPDERGVPVRYGLANESKAMNAAIKSSDLIGIRKVRVVPEMVGSVIGQFVAREVKHGAWTWGEDAGREVAQKTFIDLVLSYGGDAAFAPGPGTL